MNKLLSSTQGRIKFDKKGGGEKCIFNSEKNNLCLLWSKLKLNIKRILYFFKFQLTFFFLFDEYLVLWQNLFLKLKIIDVEKVTKLIKWIPIVNSTPFPPSTSTLASPKQLNII